MKDRERRVYNVIRVLFVSLIVVFLIVSAVKTALNRGTVSYYENRTLAAFPEFTSEGVMDGSSFSGLDSYIQDHSMLRERFLRFDTWLDLRVLKRPVLKDVLIQDDLLLVWPGFYELTDEQIEYLAGQEAANIAAHSEKTRSYGGEYYYVAVPRQNTFYADRLPSFARDEGAYERKIAAALFSAFDERNVPYIDMRKELDALGDTERFASHVDNHYSIYGALETFRSIVRRVNADTGLSLHMPEYDDFTETVLPNPYLGSRMRTMMGLWSTDEKLAALYPREYIPFTRTDLYTGAEEPVQTYPDVYYMPLTEEEEVTYNLYMGGDFPYTEIKTDRPELPTVLVYGDSFTNTLECLLYTDFDTMYSIDMRHYDRMTIDEFIELVQPDIVLCVRDYAELVSTAGNGA